MTRFFAQILALCLFVFSLVIPLKLHAATYYVRTDGSNSNSGTSTTTSGAWATLAYAVDAALSPGDIVYVMPGTYTGEVTPSVDGSSGNPIQFIADRDGSIFGRPGRVTIAATSGSNALDADSDNYLEFYGFNFRGDNDSADAVRWDGSLGGVLRDCIIYQAGDDGLDLTSGATLTVINCLIDNNDDEGVYAVSGTITILNCTIASNGGDGVRNNGATLTITNCVVNDHTYDGIEHDSGTTNNSYNLVYASGDLNWDGHSAGTGAISADPVFVDTYDFHLRSTSPAINAGTDLSGTFTDDYHDNPRPYNGGWDMGYHEFASTRGSMNLLFVTQNDGYYTSQERFRKSVLEYWGYAVVGIADSDSQANFNSALGTSNVVYVGEEVNSTDVGYKLRETTLGVVFDEDQLADEFGLSTSAVDISDHTDITITDNSHYITSPYATGALTYGLSAIDVKAFSGTLASGMQLLGDWGSSPALGAVDAGGTLANTYNGSDAAFGRRVGFIHGAGLDWEDLSADGFTLFRRALEWVSTAELIGHWKLDETTGTTATDLSDLANDGTYNSGYVLAQEGPYPGYLANAAQFDGTSGYVEVPDNPLYSSHTSTGITVAAWVKVLALNTDVHGQTRQPIVSKGSNNDWEWALFVTDSGTAAFNSWEQGGTNHAYAQGGSLPIGKWMHVAATIEPGVATRVYVNGELVGTSTSFTGTAHDGTTNLRIGSRPDGQFLNAEISDVRIYGRALEQLDIVELYGLVGHWKLDENTGTTATDSSPASLDGTYQNGVTLASGGPYPGVGADAAEFDGLNDNVDLQNMGTDFSRGFTAAFWFHPDDVPSIEYAFLGISNGQDVDDIWIGWLPGTGIELYFTDTTDGSSYRWLDDNIEPDTGKWQHYVATVDDSGNAIIYRDGEQVATGFVSLPTTTSRTENFIADSVWNDQLDGRMYDVRLYNRPLSAIEVSDIYGLVGHWKMDEGSGIAAADSTGYANGASLSGATWTSTCTGIYALEFDGVGGTAATGSDFDPPAQGTVAFWFRSEGPPTSRQRPWGVGGDFEMWQDTDGLVSCDVSTDGLAGGFITTTPLYTAGQWYHMVAVYDSADDSYSIYVDGKLHKTGISTWAVSDQAANILSFGTRTGSTQYFAGALRDFRIYNRPISNQEISDLSGLIAHWQLNETTGTVADDAAVLDHDATYVSSPTLGVNGPYPAATGTAIELDGSTDYITAGQSLLNNLSEFTIMGWVKIDDDVARQSFFGQNDLIEFGIQNTADEIYLWTNSGGSISHSQQLPPGKWVHMTAVGSGTGLTLYINGREAASGGSATSSYGSSADPFKIGEGVFTGSGDLLDGRVDDVRVYSRAMCPNEINGAYKEGRPTGVRILNWIETR